MLQRGPQSLVATKTTRSTPEVMSTRGGNTTYVDEQENAGPDSKEEEQLPEIKLAKDRNERRRYDDMADLYSIIVATEQLEQAFVRDSVNSKEYERECNKLIAQFKTLRDSLSDSVPHIEKFMADYKMNCKSAANRLLVKGVPATVEHGGMEDSGDDQLSIFHAVQHFITTMDSLKLEMRAVDEIHPHLSDLVDSLGKVAQLPSEHESKEKVKKWLLQLNSMRAHEELSDDQVRQMSFDLENAYNSFHKFLKDKKK